MSLKILPFTIQDYTEAYALWQSTPGIGLSASDGQDEIEKFLERNSGLSFIARQDNQLVGAVLGSTDGRRGYLHHLAVHSHFRHQGAGRALVEACLAGLKAQGILRCHIFVYANNQDGQQFWEKVGFFERTDLQLMSKNL